VVQITVAKGNNSEIKYIVDVLFNEYLGIDYKIIIDETCQNCQIKFNDDKTLIIEDHFFSKHPIELEYLKSENIPKKVELFKNKFTNEKHIPVIYGNSRFEASDSCITCGVDIFASCFFMLTRWEESVNKNKDIHDRFPATESLAYKNSFLDMPVVNEYVEMLKKMLLHLDGSLQFRQHNPKTHISCDVDTPYEPYVKSLKKTLRKSSGDLIKRTNLPLAVNTLKNYATTKFSDYSNDQNDTFGWIMDVNEQAGNRVAFYFLVESTVPEFDAIYNIDEPRIRQLMRIIYDRGHEIGLHGSYGTYKNGKQLKRQFAKLRRVMDEENIIQEKIGIRQHYLRWSTSETPSNMEEAGLTYDTTLGFADHAGFRCGTCFEYPLFDLKNRKQLKIIERPLVAMECSVLDDVYMGLETESASEYLQQLKKSTKQVNGNFTLLWHNSYFKNNIYRQIYENLI
jgi:hypothetical protein